MKKVRILFATNYNANDTTSYLRAWGPFTLMRDLVEIVEPLSTDPKNGWWKNWRNWFNCDVCFMHRPYGPVAAQIMAECKLAGVPLWVDHDDDLLEIPKSNPYYLEHKEGEEKFPSVEMSYKYADILTCSGQVMHEKLTTQYKRPDAILITSGLDDRLLRFKQPFSGNKKVAWRGSTSHMSDLLEIKDELFEIMKEFKDHEFFFFGIDPIEVDPKFDTLPNWKFQTQLNFFPFIDLLTKTNASVHFVPLEDNIFNRVKSNLSWLDATLAGSIVLAPRFPEFDRSGIMRYEAREFGAKLTFILDEPDAFQEMHERSWKFITENLLTSKLNQQRYEILRKI